MQQERIFEDRDTEICRLADEDNVPHSEIAERYSISRARVGQIIARANGGKSSDDIELDRLYKKLADHADNPEPRVSAIGKVTRDPDTGRVIRNRTESISAIKAQISVIKERREQRAENAPEVIPPEWTQALEWAQSLSPRIRDYENRIIILESESFTKDERIRELESELERWQRGDIVNAELTA